MSYRSGDISIPGGDRAILDRGYGFSRRGDRYSSDRWPDAAVPPSGGGVTGEDYMTNATTITHAQILAMGSTPVQIIPAPGAGNIIIPVAVYLKSVIVTPYTVPAGHSWQLLWAGGNTFSGYFSLANFLVSNAFNGLMPLPELRTNITSLTNLGASPGWSGVDITNKAVQMADWAGGNNPTGGASGNSVKVLALYQIVPAP